MKTGNKEFNAAEILVYPNPTRNYITIRTSVSFINPTINILNIATNSLVMKKKYEYVLNSQEVKFDILQLNSGAYLISVVDKNRSFSKKIIIQ